MKNRAASESDLFDRGEEAWRAEGDFGLLAAVNPARVALAREVAGGDLAGKRVLDAGCGGGIFAEAAARAGARVTAIDRAPRAIAAAAARARREGLEIDFRAAELESAAPAVAPASFDLAVCFEVLEHSAHPAAIVAAVAAALAPGGAALFSTVNRTWAARAMMIGVAERALGFLPRGAHRYDRFVAPRELARFCADSGLSPRFARGLRYSFFGKRWVVCDSPAVNYFLAAGRD